MARFGIELEVISEKTSQDIASILRDNGIDCYSEGYNHHTRRHWKIVTDASISTTRQKPYGFEIVSPILEGDDGIREAEKVAEVLNENGCDANVSCGFHVHVDASNLTKKDVANVVRAWARNEWVVDTLVPASRRSNRYCQSIHQRSIQAYTREYEKSLFDRIASAENETVDSIVEITNPSNDRFFKLNLTALRRHQTIEFRYHSGTVQPEKVIRQIQFCIAFVERFSQKRLITVFGHRSHSTTEYRKPIAKSTTELLNTLATVMPETERKQFKSYWKSRQRQLAA